MKNLLKLKSILALAVMATIVFSIVPTAFACNPNISIDTINGYSSDEEFDCFVHPLFSPIILTGSGSGSAPPGQIEQYHVQIDWGDGFVTNDLGVFVPPSGCGSFNFTFNAGPHSYDNGNYTITARLYHQQPPGNDNQADAFISIPICVVVEPPILTVKKHVINDDEGCLTASDFNLHVKINDQDVYNSPVPGSESGTIYTLAYGTHIVSEDPVEGYNSTISGDCDPDGSITLNSGDVKTCTITNDDITPPDPYCGDGEINGDEVCEIGDTQPCQVEGYNGEQYCNQDCLGWERCQATEYCGDNILNGNEECDDGNNDDGDGCSASCLEEVCQLDDTQPCDTGLLGICAIGTQICDLYGEWSLCTQDNQPTDEVCNNGLDDNCNGYTDCEDEGCFQDYVCQPTSLTFTKTAEDLNGSPLVIGDIIRYILEVMNIGDYIAYNVVVTDDLPDIVTCLDITGDDAPATCTDPLVWTIPSLATGTTATLQIDVSINPDTEGQAATNTGTVTGSNIPDPPDNPDPVCLDGSSPVEGVCPVILDCKPEATTTCSTGLSGICSDGTQTCSAEGEWGECIQDNQATDEICNDDLDNDCDGDVDGDDEDCIDGPECTYEETQSCDTGELGICSTGTQTCDQDGYWGECVPDNEPVSEICTNGLDDDCDGIKDEDCQSPPLATSGGGGGGGVSIHLDIFNEKNKEAQTNSIIVTWFTSRSATSRVIYDTVPHSSLGAPPNYGYAYSTPEDTNKVAFHTVTIDGLIPGTTYYWRAISRGSPEVWGKELVFETKTGEEEVVGEEGGGTEGEETPGPIIPPDEGGVTGPVIIDEEEEEEKITEVYPGEGVSKITIEEGEETLVEEREGFLASLSGSLASIIDAFKGLGKKIFLCLIIGLILLFIILILIYLLSRRKKEEEEEEEEEEEKKSSPGTPGTMNFGR